MKLRIGISSIRWFFVESPIKRKIFIGQGQCRWPWQPGDRDVFCQNVFAHWMIVVKYKICEVAFGSHFFLIYFTRGQRRHITSFLSASYIGSAIVLIEVTWSESYIRVFPKWSKSEFTESEKSLKHDLGSTVNLKLLYVTHDLVVMW